MLSRKIYYWRGAIGDVRLLDEHKSAMERLINQTYAHSDLEILKGHRDIYSYRLNQTARLLFTTIERGGQRYLLLLEHLPTHDYAKSRFLKSRVLTRYLSNHDEEITSVALEFEQATKLPFLTEKSHSLEESTAIAVDYYQHEFIQLSDNQEKALNMPLPLLVSGVAGSGKSCVAITLISNVVHSLDNDDAIQLPILYVTQSEGLARTMQSSWRALPVSQNLPTGCNVIFLTYEELLYAQGIVGSQALVGYNDFDSWYQKYIARQNTIAKAKKSVNLLESIDSDAAYQECRICCAYNEEDYCNLGERQTLLAKDKYLRKALYAAYLDYKESLVERQRLHPAFCLIAKSAMYHLIVVDEAQDLSHLQLKNLAELAQHGRSIFLMDSHQSLTDKISKRPFLFELLKLYGEERCHTLNCLLRIDAL